MHQGQHTPEATDLNSQACKELALKELTHLGWFPVLELRVVLADQIKIFFIEDLFLFALCSPALSAPTPFTLVRIAVTIFLILVDDESFADLFF